MRLKTYLSQAIHWLGSLKLAVVLMMGLATSIAVATILEADSGRVYAQWHVYHSGWFFVLLGLLGVNIFAAAASRWPWKRHQTGFVVTHGGLLVLLAGSVQSFLGGVDGQVTLTEGETASAFVIPQQSQITAHWLGQHEEAPYHFTFEAGPSDWAEGTQLDLGAVDGVSARVLRYYAHAEAKEDWIEDATGAGGPAVKFRIEGPDGKGGEEHLLVDQDFGDEIFGGPVRLQLRRASSQAMVDNFLKPPTENLGKKGLLLAYYKDRVASIAVDENLGNKVPLGDTGMAVEIAEYMANAKPDMNHRFRSAGDEPHNPLLELRVHEPGKEAMRQLAFAKSPLLNLDPVHGRACPVKFHYLHPAVQSGTAIELLQADDGQLYCRVFADRQLLPKGVVEVGSRIPMPGKFTFSLVEHVPHARLKTVFESRSDTGNQKDKSAPAVEIEITAGGATRTYWLQRHDPIYGSRTMATPKGILAVQFGQGQAPLGFSLKLVEFRKGVNPGGVGNAEFSSVVRLIDEDNAVDEERVISMNEPLTYGGLTFYQSAFNEAGHGMKSSTFSVGYDPGRMLKYGGCLLICLGIAIMFYMRAYFFKRSVSPGTDGEELVRENASSEKGILVRAAVPSLAPEAACRGPQEIVAADCALVAEETVSTR